MNKTLMSNDPHPQKRDRNSRQAPMTPTEADTSVQKIPRKLEDCAKVTEKPPPGPMKRKKKLDRSLVDLSCSPKMEQKRQKTSDEKPSPIGTVKKQHPQKEVTTSKVFEDATKSSSSSSTTMITTRSAKAKGLQNHTLFKLKRKTEETNAALVQKLNAYTEQLRLEINGLKTSLVSEKNAVRALRAQQDALSRKMKLEAKNGKARPTAPKKTTTVDVAFVDQRTTITARSPDHSEAEMRKSINDPRDKDASRLTQISNAAKIEINRLLEEIKVKDKTIQGLKKEQQQHHQQHQQPKLQQMKKDVTKKLCEMRKDNGNAIPQTKSPNKPPVGKSSHENADLSECTREDNVVLSTDKLKSAEQIYSQMEFMQTENEILKSELGIAQERISSLQTHLANLQAKGEENSIYDRIRELEYKESELMKEAHELREQNDLLEFRIVELEESHDKWSLRSQTQSSQSTAHTRDVWTDTEKESDDLMMLSDRSDSGVTSPHSNHQSEDRLSMPSPCDLTMIDNIPSDDIRKRILSMTKRTCYDEEDKICLMQILSLLNNLEALSQDQEISGEFSSLDSTASKHMYPPASKNRIVATVQPYTESAFYEEPITPHLKNGHQRMATSSNSKVMLWTSLQESGVFEEPITMHQSTQTHTDEFPFPERPNPSGELSAEIQKLNKFRERIEKVVGHNKSASGVVKLLSPDQRKLEYYKGRVDTLESKLIIYESSDDIQLRRLRERLQREVQLESLTRQLQEQIAELEKTNQVIEEERCELEELENDTRLKYQKLEVDFEMVTQRNVELEMNEEALQMKLQEAKNKIAMFEEEIRQLEARIENLTKSNEANYALNKISTEGELELNQQIVELQKRELNMQQTLDELKRAYNETLENADNVWAEMENEYKMKLKQCEMNEVGLQSKLQQLEERIKHDSQFAQERLAQMEELEVCLKQRIATLNRENKDLSMKYSTLIDECNNLKDEYQQLKAYVTGPAAEVLDRERKRIATLEEELQHAAKMLKQMEAKNKDNVIGLKFKMSAAIKELENIRITNNELQEEVVTLEARIMESKRVQSIDDETIRHLTEELRTKQKQLNQQHAIVYKAVAEPTLAQELACHFPPAPVLTTPTTAISEDVRQMTQKGMKRLADSTLELNGKPKLLPKPEDIGRLIMKTRDEYD